MTTIRTYPLIHPNPRDKEATTAALRLINSRSHPELMTVTSAAILKKKKMRSSRQDHPNQKDKEATAAALHSFTQ